MTQRESLPPNSPEAERGVLGCCLLNVAKTKAAMQAGVTSSWFYDLRHAEIFKVLAGMASNGGGDALVAMLKLRQLGKLDGMGEASTGSHLTIKQSIQPVLNHCDCLIVRCDPTTFLIVDTKTPFQRSQAHIWRKSLHQQDLLAKPLRSDAPGKRGL